MICSKCSTDIDDGVQFCPSCGSAVADASPAADKEEKKGRSPTELVISVIVGVAIFGWWSGWFSSDAPESQVAPQQNSSQPVAASAQDKAKTIQEWAQTITARSTPAQVIALIGRPDATQEAGAQLVAGGDKRYLVFSYRDYVRNPHTGNTDLLRVAFSWGSAYSIQQGSTGKEIQLPL